VSREPPQYLVARLRHSLAMDPRTAEQGVRVKVRGDTVYLSGDVTTAQRRELLTEVVAELAPEMKIRNDVRLVPSGTPPATEELW
jgi:osmotically-inducible protein OsmY